MNPTTVLSFPHKDRRGNDTFLTLEVSRGATNFPQRPVTVPRFLIGAGSGCDMKLGGQEIPPLHTVMIIDESRVTVEAIAASPPLILNGRPVETAGLNDGDTLAIGQFEFRVLFHELAISQTAASSTNLLDIEIDEHESLLPETEDLSAAELVDLLEEEQSQVDSFNRAVLTGSDALLHAVQTHQASSQARPPESTKPLLPGRHVIHDAHGLRGPSSTTLTANQDEQFVHEFERVRQELESFSRELEKRFEQTTRREAYFDAAAKELVEAQGKLSAQLGTLLEQIETHREEDQPRAIA